MWNVTQTPEYSKCLSDEQKKRWSRVNTRGEDLKSIRRNGESALYSLKDIIDYWMSKESSLCELRKIIFESDQDKPAHLEFMHECIQHYVSAVDASFSDKPHKILDSISHYEVFRKLDMSRYMDASYEFLNALFACFPELVLQTPGLMQGKWKDEALKPENAGKTIIGLTAGYQSYFVHRSNSSFSNMPNLSDSFYSGFKDAFGIHPDRLSMQLTKPCEKQSKQVLSYYKRSVAKTASRDYSVPTRLRNGLSGGGLAITALAKAGVFADRPVFDGLSQHLGADRRAILLTIYLTQGFCAEDKIGRFFEIDDVRIEHVNYMLSDSHEAPEDDFRRFLSVFPPEDQAALQIKTGFPIHLLKDSQSRRIVLSSDLNL
jgi:hypothetical protein